MLWELYTKTRYIVSILVMTVSVIRFNWNTVYIYKFPVRVYSYVKGHPSFALNYILMNGHH